MRPLFAVLALSLTAAAAAAGVPGADQFTVAACPNAAQIPVTFQIDCSNVASQKLKKLCGVFIQNQACLVSPAYRKITGIKLEDICPSVQYMIYDTDKWPYQGGEAGGMAGKCKIDYMTQYSVAAPAPANIGPYDSHEILHEYQMALGALPYAHSLFGPSQAELKRLIGDADGYEQAIGQMKKGIDNARAANWNHTATATMDQCVFVELYLEAHFYVSNNATVYDMYRKLVRSFVRDQGDREARFNRMYVAVSDPRTRDFLVAHGCAPFQVQLTLP